MSEDRLWEDDDGSPSSIFRPSYSSTWLNCSGALLPSRWAADTAGYDAAVGTVFHELMAEWQTNERPDSWLGMVIEVPKPGSTEVFEVLVDEEMFVHGAECIARYADIPGQRFVETKVDISDLTPIPGQTGTADLAILSPHIMDTIDWKYGKGVWVFAKNNSQELLYCWGLFIKYDPIYHFEKIRLHIAQPRLNNWDVWEITREELIEFAAYAKERAHASWQRGADRSPSPAACQWCKVRATCTALETIREAVVDQSFDVIDEPITEATMIETKNQLAVNTQDRQMPNPVSLSTEDLARIYRWRPLMEKWFREVGEVLMTRALGGEQATGWKIVEGRSLRRWTDQEVAAEKLCLLLPEDEVFQRRIVSPAQAEKLLRAAGVGGALLKSYMRMLVYKPPGKPTLAPDGDNRWAIPNIVDDSFETPDDEAAL